MDAGVGYLNENGISLEEVAEAVNEISCKAPGLDGFPVECLKGGTQLKIIGVV